MQTTPQTISAQDSKGAVAGFRPPTVYVAGVEPSERTWDGLPFGQRLLSPARVGECFDPPKSADWVKKRLGRYASHELPTGELCWTWPELELALRRDRRPEAAPAPLAPVEFALAGEEEARALDALIHNTPTKTRRAA